VSSMEDMAALFDEIPLDRISASMTINATAPILLACYTAVARRRGIPLTSLSGTIQNDILKEYIARGTYVYPPHHAMRLVTDVLAWCDRELPSWNPISISGYHMREAGATAAQELGFTLANAVAYVEAARDAGLDLTRIGTRLSFFFAAHNDFLEEIAKFRAARRLWAHLMRDRFGVTDDRACQLRFHTQTAGSTLTAQQPDNNVVRVTLQALAAVLGGTQSLHCNGRDEALGLPSAESAQLALRTQQVIAYETGLTQTVDPFGGSFEVERRTAALEAEALALLDRIDRVGGTLRAIEQGLVQREIQEAAYRTHQAIEEGSQVVVGVNRFADPAPAIQPFRIDPDAETRQCARVADLKTRRDSRACQRALDDVRGAARDGTNVMPPILAAVEAHATVGEIADELRRVFGEHRERHT
jgi:methylmalonyl-CoA mutase N-terminal domain/subunit